MANKFGYKRPYCEVCGEVGGCYTADGWVTCLKHFKTAKPEKPLYDHVTGECITTENASQ